MHLTLEFKMLSSGPELEQEFRTFREKQARALLSCAPPHTHIFRDSNWSPEKNECPIRDREPPTGNAMPSGSSKQAPSKRVSDEFQTSPFEALGQICSGKNSALLGWSPMSPK